MADRRHLAVAVEMLRAEGMTAGPEPLSAIIDSLEFTVIVLRVEARVGSTWTREDLDRLGRTPLSQLIGDRI